KNNICFFHTSNCGIEKIIGTKTIAENSCNTHLQSKYLGGKDRKFFCYTEFKASLGYKKLKNQNEIPNSSLEHSLLLLTQLLQWGRSLQCISCQSQLY
ncbi:mCG145850, partial [Mus musculus]